MNIHQMRLCRYADLKHPEITNLNNLDPFNLYLILKGNSININTAESKILDSNELVLKFNVNSRSTIETKEQVLSINPKYSNDLTLEIEYPNKIFKLQHKDKLVTGGQIGAILRNIRGKITENRSPQEMDEPDGYDYLDLELLYVGQSQGSKRKLTAINRLQNHSTFLKILATELEDDPCCEIWIGLIQFELIVLLVNLLTGLTSENKKDDIPNTYTMQKLLNSNKYRKESINIAEAALIKFFEPKYNFEFADNFPSPYHKSYKLFYEIGIHTVMVEFFPYVNISSRISTAKRKKFACGFISYQLNGNSATIGPLTFPSHNVQI